MRRSMVRNIGKSMIERHPRGSVMAVELRRESL